jgi:hypothetical protein
MTCKFVSAALLGGLLLAVSAPAEAAQKRYNSQPATGNGYTIRHGGGYSYTYADAINTTRDSRDKNSAGAVFRDPGLERQSPGGPFDQGFFFDSGIGPQGGQSPYMH